MDLLQNVAVTCIFPSVLLLHTCDFPLLSYPVISYFINQKQEKEEGKL